MIKIMRDTIEKHNLIDRNDKIVVAVSGGADSVALLHGLWILKDEYNLTLTVCHLNHMLRGDDSDGDARYVKELCDELNITSHIFSENVDEYSKKMKLSFEEGAREVRYRLFDEVLKVSGSNKIAVAQNMNDQAETILMRLSRGSGLEGLTSIKYKRDNIIRPILSVSRDVIESYCADNNLLFRTDHTNFECVYTRNKIRLELIPYLKENFNENIIHQLFATTELLKSDLDFISSAVEEKYKEIVVDKGNIFEMDKLVFNNCHLAIKSRLIRKLISDMIGDIKGISIGHIDELIELFANSSHGSHKIIKKYIRFEISYDNILIYDIRKKNVSCEESYFVDEVLAVSGGILTLSNEYVSDRKNLSAITIDADKIKGKLKVRNRKTGDRFTPIGMSGSKKIKDLFIDLKIPAKDRDDVLLLCDDDEIIWIVGYRMSEHYKIDANTVNRSTIEFKKE